MYVFVCIYVCACMYIQSIYIYQSIYKTLIAFPVFLYVRFLYFLYSLFVTATEGAIVNGMFLQYKSRSQSPKEKNFLGITC